MQETISRTAMSETSTPTPVRDIATPVPSQDKLLSLILEWEPWHTAFARRVREFFKPPKLPPLQLTSKPVAVPDMWSGSRQNRYAKPISVLLHVVVIALIVI